MDDFYLFEEDFTDSDSLDLSYSSPSPSPSSLSPRSKIPFIDQHFNPYSVSPPQLNLILNLSKIPAKETPLLIRKHKKKFTFSIENQSQISVFTLLSFLSNKEKNGRRKNNNLYISWTYMEHTTQQILSAVILNQIKQGYAKIKNNFSVLSANKHSSNLPKFIEETRKEDPFSTSFFHFIYSGKTKITDNGEILFPNNNSSNLTMFFKENQSNEKMISQNHSDYYSFSTIKLSYLFKSLGPESFSIFDGDYSGRALSTFINIAQNDSSNSTVKNDNITYSRCFCLCSCQNDERMPDVAGIPRDFLTVCLLTPVRVAILCHIYHNYRSKMDSFLEDIQENKEEYDKFTEYLNCIITVITEAIAIDFISSDLFTSLFRRDSHIAVFFQRFIMCQFLLDKFNVHPVCYPFLPQMQKHSLWSQLSFAIDQCIIKQTYPNPLPTKDLFHSAILSFFTNFNKNEQDRSIISIVSSMPALFKSAEDLYPPLAYFASISTENKYKIMPLLHYNKIFSILFNENHVSGQLYHACAYLLLISDMDAVDFPIILQETPNVSFLMEVIMKNDTNFNKSTRAIITAIFSKLISWYQPAHNLCITEQFFETFSKLIVEQEPQFLMWLFILLKRIWLSFSIDKTSFIDSNIHLQIASNLMNDSYEIRASCIAALSVFMQTNEQFLNRYLFLVMIPSFVDASYIVRYQFLMFLLRYLQSNKITVDSFNLLSPSSTLRQFFDIFYGNIKHFAQILNNFSFLSKASVDAANTSLSQKKLDSSACFLLEYFCYDPCPLISGAAQKAIDVIASSQNKFIAPPFNSTNQNPVFGPSKIEMKSDTYEFPDDSDVLFSYAYEQLTRASQWNADISINKQEKKDLQSFFHRRSPKEYESYSYMPSKISRKCYKNISEKQIQKLAFYSHDSSLVCVHSSNILSKLDDLLALETTMTLSQSICDLITKRVSYDKTLTICSTLEGSIHVCDMDEGDEVTCFRAGFNFKDQKSPQLIATHEKSTTIATGRGSNGVCLWDLETQKIIGEWKTPDLYAISTMSILNSDENLCICGLNNGCLTPVDFRTPQNSQPSKILNSSMSDKVVHVANFFAQEQVIYAASVNGIITSWDTRGDQILTVTKKEGPIFSFDSHTHFPVLFCSSAKESPEMLTPNMQFIGSLDNIGPNSFISAHQRLNLISFGDALGNVHVFELL